MLRRILDFALDFAFVEGEVLDPAVHKQAWLSDQLCFIARHDHPVFRQPGSPYRHIGQYEWVLREPGSGTREIFLRAIAGVFQAPPVVALEVNDADTQLRIVRSSDWLGCMSRRVRGTETDDDGLREIPIPRALQKALTRRFWIVRHPDRFYSQAMATVDQIAASFN